MKTHITYTARFLLILAVTLFSFPQLTCADDEVIDFGPIGGIIKELHKGFKFTEGPAADRQGNIYFTDIPENKIYKVDLAGKLTTFTDQSGHANGLMFNAKGELVACQMDGQLVAFDLKTKKTRALVASYNGKRFNAPNDLVIDQSGGVYFTDPHFRSPKPLPQGKMGVYYTTAIGKTTRLIDDLPAPNGVILSPDEKTLYVIPSGQSKMMAYKVKGPGEIGKGRVFYTLRQPEGRKNTGGDGLTIDTEGNLYITSQTGIQVVSPKGKLLYTIICPQKPANVTFGGKDMKTLYITARTGLYSARMTSQGHVFLGKKKK